MKKRSNKNFRVDGFLLLSNEEFAEAMREKRRSSATQRHTLARFKGTRTAQTKRAIRDSFE